VTDDDGHLVLTVIPDGAASREMMGVLIEGEGAYRARERTFREKAGA
jgi:hypothetical protein